ncbi:uncharacterized protein LOC143291267 isoform X2 [Babylonia areolata]
MEAALKEVFNVHRKVVRSLRLQVHETTQERDELKQKLNQTREQIQNAVSKLTEQKCTLRSFILNLKSQEVCICQRTRSSTHGNCVLSPSNKNQDALQVLEQQVNILVQTLSTVSQGLTEVCDIENQCQGEGHVFLSAGDRGQNQGLDRSQGRVRDSSPSDLQNASREKQDQQSHQLGDKHQWLLQPTSDSADRQPEKYQKVLSENRANLKGQQKLEEVENRSVDMQNQQKAPRKETLYRLTEAPGLQRLGDSVTDSVNDDAECQKGVEKKTSALQKSPEPGTKLQLMRNAAKRRRYTEDDGVQKRRRLCTHAMADSKADRCDADADCTVGEQDDTSHNLRSSSAIRRHSHYAGTGSTTPGSRHTTPCIDTGAAPKSREMSEVPPVVYDTQGNSQSFSPAKNVGDEARAADNDSPVTGIPETLGMDLYTSQPEEDAGEETAVSPARCSVPGGDSSCANLHSKERETSGSSHCRTKNSSNTGGAGDGEKCDNVQQQKSKCDGGQQTKRSGEGTSSQGVWPTDSVVFSSAGPRLARRLATEPANTSSLLIDEQQKTQDCLSPVFLTHRNEHGDRSPALFDEGDSDADNDDCIPSSPVTVLSRTLTRRSTQQSATGQKRQTPAVGGVESPEHTAVSPVSPMLLQPSWVTSGGAVTGADPSRSRPQSSAVTPADPSRSRPQSSAVTPADPSRSRPQSSAVTPADPSRSRPQSSAVTPADPSRSRPQSSAVTPADLSRSRPQSSAVTPADPSRSRPQSSAVTPADPSRSRPPSSAPPVKNAVRRKGSQSHTQGVPDNDGMNLRETVSPCPPGNGSARGDPHFSSTTVRTEGAAWNPAPRKKLFKPKAAPALPSADETINPCLLHDGSQDKGRGDKTSEDMPLPSGNPATDEPVSSPGNPTAVCSQLNASMDPAVRLTQYLNDPTQTAGDGELCELSEEEEGDVTLDPRFQRAHLTSGQDVTMMMSLSSSEAYTGGQTSMPLVPAGEVIHPTTAMDLLEDSFDRVPQRKEQSYAYAEVVRKRAERKKLKGFTCQECEKYYGALGLSVGEMRGRMGQCSRHRARQMPPSTPEHFWSIGFPDTQECEERYQISAVKNGQR